MALATRLDNLGTETAFAVSLAAAEWGQKGNRIFPFHLGDINLPTSQNIVDAMNRAIADGKPGYCPGAGIPQLREALAANVGGDRGLSFDASNVVVQPGGKPVITKFIQTIMNPGDEVLYPNPGYPIYESQIEYFGGIAKPYRYIANGNGFSIDIDQIKSLITPRTKAIVYNDLQNPNGAESTDAEREAIAEIAIANNLYVLSDEAYFEMRYEGKSKSISSLPGMAERTVILYTFSKKFAMTGWRLGWLVLPPSMTPAVGKLIEFNTSCAPVFVQRGATVALQRTEEVTPALVAHLKTCRDTLVPLLAEVPGVSVATPRGGMYAFFHIDGYDDCLTLAKLLVREAGLGLAPGSAFGGEAQGWLRWCFASRDVGRLEEGVERLRGWLKG